MKLIDELLKIYMVKVNIMAIVWIGNGGTFYSVKFSFKYDILLNVFGLQVSVTNLGLFEPKPVCLYISRT
jgi:hypothetical protein